MTVSDIKTIVDAVKQIDGECVIQLSTYSNDYGRSAQCDVKSAIVEGFHPAGLKALAVMRASEKMMSIVIGRPSSPVATELSDMAELFDSWFDELRYSWKLEQFRSDPTNAGKLPPMPRPRSPSLNLAGLRLLQR